MEWIRGNFTVSTDKSQLSIAVIHGFLKTAYWSRDIPEKTVRKAIDGSLCFGLHHGSKQIGFARAVTDGAVFAYIADVFVLEEYRGRGLGKWLVSCIMFHPALLGLRRIILATADAHGLYSQFGFTPLAIPDNVMEIKNSAIYRQK